MSVSEPLSGDPNLHSHDPLTPEPDRLAAEGDAIPPDPLLESGSFIEPTVTKERPASEGDGETSGQPEPWTSRVTAVSSSGDGVTSPTPSQRSNRFLLPDRPEWLPEGWRFDRRVRSSGASAGSVDRYYIEPTSGSRFRSRKEVEYFVQTGVKRKKSSTPESANRPAAQNFDHVNVPEKVCWTLFDACKDQWHAQMGREMVPESTTKLWKSYFVQAAKNGGKPV